MSVDTQHPNERPSTRAYESLVILQVDDSGPLTQVAEVITNGRTPPKNAWRATELRVRIRDGGGLLPSPEFDQDIRGMAWTADNSNSTGRSSRFSAQWG